MIPQLESGKPSDLKIYLWPDGIPSATRGDAFEPALLLYRPIPEKANATAVIVCPGGAYIHVADEHEGTISAEWLARLGVTSFVLSYRTAPQYHHPAPWMLGEYFETVRARASQWNIDSQRIGMWGFSAGGHLASTAATRFDDGDPAAQDPIERVSCRPDFLILSYPVITMSSPFAHMGSRVNLIGEEPDDGLGACPSNRKGCKKIGDIQGYSCQVSK